MHPTVSDVRAALSLIDCDAYSHVAPGEAYVNEIDGYADGTIRIGTPGLIHVARRSDGQRWQRSTRYREMDLEAASRTIAELFEGLSAIEDRGYGHIRIARIATDDAGVWRVWGPTAAAIAEILDVDCGAPEAAITSI